MVFLRPELLLLAVPVLWLLWRLRPMGRTTGVLRACVALLLLVALSEPALKGMSQGRDLLLLIDRSRSMPADADSRAMEWVELSEAARSEGDRVGVIAFGGSSAIERVPAEESSFRGFERDVAPDGTDLHAALELALGVLSDDRPSSLCVVSDGEHNGRDLTPTLRRAFARGIRVDVLPVMRDRAPDLAVLAFDLPERVDAGEPFQFRAWVHADEPTTANWRLLRGGVPIRTGQQSFGRGRNQLVFRDVLNRGGVVTYALELDTSASGHDRIPENDRGLGALWVVGERPLLVLNHDGQPDALTEALTGASLPLEIRRPESLTIDAIALTRYRGVILENVEAGRVLGGLGALAEFVEERGGGLWICGGQASFGVGGYHLSALDATLPVSMEMRDEDRQQGLALAIALDRSGSMAAPVGDGRTKMSLANEASAAALDLLGNIDAAAVLAVDTRAKAVLEMMPADSARSERGRVLGIRSSGGGINTLTALRASARALADAPQVNKHILLFADASDADEQGGAIEFTEDLADAGVSVSVVALGAATDQHVGFLTSLASVGGGDFYVSESAMDLPRLFAQDTLTVARSAFIEARTETAVQPEMVGLGELQLDRFPALDGYNLTHVRPGANQAVVTTDDFAAPALAYWQRGLGRAVAFTGQVGGSFGAEVVAWPEFARWAVTLARWILGQEEPLPVYATARREGREAVVEVELDPSVKSPVDPTTLALRVGAGVGEWHEVPLTRTGRDTLEARWTLAPGGVSISGLQLDDGRRTDLAPLALPYSPEFDPRGERQKGLALLRGLAEDTGGVVDPLAGDLFRGEREGRRYRPIVREALLAALLVMLVEIAGRRLQLWKRAEAAPTKVAGTRRRRKPSAPARAPEPERPARTREVSDVSGALARARAAARRETDRM